MPTIIPKVGRYTPEYVRWLIRAERDLAVIMGYKQVSTPIQTAYDTNLYGISYGTPRPGYIQHPEALPKWCRGWFYCAPLIGKYKVSIQFIDEGSAITASTAGQHYTVHVEDHCDVDHALFYAIVKAVTMRLAAIQ